MRTPTKHPRPAVSEEPPKILQDLLLTLRSIARSLEELGFNGAITRMPGSPTLGIGERMVLALDRIAATRPGGGRRRRPKRRADAAPNPAPIERSALRMAEAAAALGISRAKCYDLVAKGLIPSLKLGKTRRVPVAALEAFLKANRMEDKR